MKMCDISVSSFMKPNHCNVLHFGTAFPWFLLTLNTSVNQQSHSVTTIVMLGEEEKGKKANAFLEAKKKKETKDNPPLKKTNKLIRRKNEELGNKNSDSPSPPELKEKQKSC